MKISGIFLIVTAMLAIAGCRHPYEPAPAPYCCQPNGCGCAPACAPACNNPCAPPGNAYLRPQAATIPATPPTYVAPAPGTYPGQMVNPNQNVGPR